MTKVEILYVAIGFSIIITLFAVRTLWCVKKKDYKVGIAWLMVTIMAAVGMYMVIKYNL